MNTQLTSAIVDWLENRSCTDIKEGAELLLQCNHNKTLYKNILKHPVKMREKLVYELKKFAPTAQPGVIKKPEKTIPKKAKTKKINQLGRLIDFIKNKFC